MIRKRTIFLCLTLLHLGALATEASRKITGNTILNSKLLKMIDGKSFGIDGRKIRAMLIIRTHILHMLHGTLKNNQRVGSYVLDNKHYTVKELYESEKNGTLPNQNARGWLKIVKEDFATKIEPFLELGRGSKPEMLILIEESLRLHKRQNSILHMWAQEPEGDDMVGFDREVQSFEHHFVFLNDLLNFLDDLISSAPKACQQFLEGLANPQERKTYAQRFHDVFERQKQKINNKA